MDVSLSVYTTRTKCMNFTYISGIECVCQKNARLQVFTACAKFLRALI